MLNLLSISLEAHREPNVHRAYRLRVDQDLLGDWSVEIRFGRVGAQGRTIRYPASSQEEARAYVMARLRRRLSAPRRIGVSYTIIDVAALSSTGVAQDWLPAGFTVTERARCGQGDAARLEPRVPCNAVAARTAPDILPVARACGRQTTARG